MARDQFPVQTIVRDDQTAGYSGGVTGSADSADASSFEPQPVGAPPLSEVLASGSDTGGVQITGLPVPSADDHPATKGYVDGLSQPPTFALDNFTLDPTYGDHYAGSSLDAKWTRRSRAAESEEFFESWMRLLPYDATSWGDFQAFTDKDEFEIQMALAFWNGAVGEGVGPAILNSAGTGLWLGFRETSRLGLFAVTTYVTGTEPVANLGYAGATWLGRGNKAWFSITKKKCHGVDLYWFRVSFDGVSWTIPLGGYDPTDFTPAKIGWMLGVQNAGGLNRTLAIDWFNVLNAGNVGNNLLRTPTSGTVTLSTTAASPSGTLAATVDGSISGEWYHSNTEAAGVYWQAAFSVPQTINGVRLRTRSDPFGFGWVELSDGSKHKFYCQQGSGAWFYVEFPAVATSYIRVVYGKQGAATNPGWTQIEAYLAS